VSDPARVPLSVVRDDVRLLSAYPVPAAEGLVKLDMMENPYGLPRELALELGRRLGAVALNRYPPGEPRVFKQRLRARVAIPEGSAVLLGNGSDELIHLVIQACARPGAVVLSPWPSFAMYRISAGLDRCGFIDVSLQPDFAMDLPAMLAAMRQHRPTVIFLSYPNNPTGNLFDRTAIEAIVHEAPGIVVIDEAYLPFAQQTWMPQLPRYPNLLVLRTFSKLGLAGLRLGYLCGPPALVEQFDKVRPPFNVNVLTLAAADFLLDHYAVLEQQAARVRADRQQLLERLRGLAAVQVYDSAANFLLFRVADAPNVFAKLLRQGILIKDVSGAHPLLHNCLRVTIGTAEENARFFDALGASI
jgi:histidinol-phosphate aminotransferase